MRPSYLLSAAKYIYIVWLYVAHIRISNVRKYIPKRSTVNHVGKNSHTTTVNYRNIKSFGSPEDMPVPTQYYLYPAYSNSKYTPIEHAYWRAPKKLADFHDKKFCISI